MAEAEVFKIKIPPAVLKYLAPDAPREARLMAARGLVPMGPSVLLTALTYFLGDADEELRNTARATMLDMPPSVLFASLREPAHPKTLDFYGREKFGDETILEAILLNNHTPDETFVFLAGQVAERFVTIIANNQVRLLRAPAVAEGLRKNPNALKSVIDTMVSFLRISGVTLEGESPELTKEEIQQIINAPEPTEEDVLPEELTDELKEGEELTEQKKQTIYQRIQKLSVSQKVKLALKGNKEARSILIKDSNRIVASAVVKNPGITDGEVMGISQMRSIHDDIIRIISQNPEWTKNYNLQFNLTSNPKTPFPVALKFLRQMRVPELKKLSGNRNIPAQLTKIAKEMFEKKR